MPAAVIRFPKIWRGDRNNRHFVAHVTPSVRLKRECALCHKTVRRSWRTGILWSCCFSCRYLKMIYGPNIKVTIVEE